MIAARWAAVRARVDAAARAAGRAPGEITIVAVAKKHPAAAVVEACAAGAADVGENYVQELVAKRAELAARGPSPRWHFIGRLQRNKAKAIAGQVALVHAVDSLELAAELGKHAAAHGATQPILLAVNAAGEVTKGGVPAAEVAALLAAIGPVPGVRVEGLMTMPPPVDDPAVNRPYFEALRRLRDDLSTPDRPLPILSMGMSDDLEVAIACGATHVRVGTAIFGARPTAVESPP